MKPRALVAIVVLLASFGSAASAEIADVTWASLRHASGGLGSLGKTSGGDAWNGGASGTRALASGDGAFDFVAGAAVGLYTVGLSESDRALDPAEMAYAIQLDERGSFSV